MRRSSAPFALSGGNSSWHGAQLVDGRVQPSVQRADFYRCRPFGSGIRAVCRRGASLHTARRRWGGTVLQLRRQDGATAVWTVQRSELRVRVRVNGAGGISWWLVAAAVAICAVLGHLLVVMQRRGPLR